jgi:FkbM family methyltransferase
VRRDGVLYDLDLRDNLQRMMYLDLSERDFRRRVMARVPVGGRVVDVGAHVGFWSLAAARRVGPQGQVLSFEPNPWALQRFQRNIALNQASPLGPIEIVAKALGGVSGEADLLAEDLEEYSYLASLHGHEPRSNTDVQNFQRITVPVITLDSVVQGPVDLLKIDVEGHEMAVLDGAEHLFAGSPPRQLVIEIEASNLARAGQTPEALACRLEGWGYRMIDCDRGIGLKRRRPLDNTFFDTVAWEYQGGGQAKGR